MNIQELDTPALIVDLDLMEENLRRMQHYCADKPFSLRPHTKAHKIPEIAKMQIAHGAKGICTAKLGEAEVMVAAGLDDVLITTPIANPQKLKRLIGLKKTHPQARILQVVDHPLHVEAISKEAETERVEIDLLVEVEVGQQRCGIEVGDALLSLAKKIEQVVAVRFAGLQAYSGHLQHIADYSKRYHAARSAIEPVSRFVQETLVDQGLAPEIVSGGGTGTYDAYEGLGLTEIQAGSYLFMDDSYRRIGSRDGDSQYRDFDCALKVWTTVISRHPTRAVVDAGMKSLSTDSGMPILERYPNVHYHSGGDEHGILKVREDFSALRVGQKLAIIPSHCDTTLNQFDRLYGVRQDLVEVEWAIAARGCSD